jgi:hypothetical protein
LRAVDGGEAGRVVAGSEDAQAHNSSIVHTKHLLSPPHAMCDTPLMTPAETSRQNLLDHGLPAGLLPDNVSTVDHDPSTGHFSVVLTATATRTIESYSVRYATIISGVLAHGRVERLKGVQVKRGIWIHVSTMVAEGDTVVVSVGPIKKRLSVSSFG